MIYLIAGHHNSDPGAVANGYKEADLTKIIRDLTYESIKRISPKSFVTKDDDRDTLSQVIGKIRPKIQYSDVLVDIHYNSGGVTATGVECVVNDNAGAGSIKIANELCDTISKISGIKNRGVKRERDTPRGKLGILGMKGDSVIVEMGFISNIKDLESLNKHLHWICEDMAYLIVKHHDSK